MCKIVRDTSPILFCPAGQGSDFIKGYAFYSVGLGSKPLSASGGAHDIGFLLSALAVPGVTFCLLLSSNGKVPKIAGVASGGPLRPSGGLYGHSFPVVRPGSARGRLLLVTFQQWKVTKDCRGSPGPQGRGWGYKVRATFAEVAVAARQSHLMRGTSPPHVLPLPYGEILSVATPQKNAADGAWINRTLSGICPFGIPSGYPRQIVS